jgi:hypothetical protein
MAEEAAAVKGTVVLSLRGVKLANRDGWFGKSDPFFVLSKGREDGAFTPCAKSNVVKNDLSPSWQPLRLPLQRLCNGDLQRPLRLEVLDYDEDDKFESIGWMMVTTQELLQPGWQGKLKHPKGKDKDVGTVVVAAAQLVQEPSFMECVPHWCIHFLSTRADAPAVCAATCRAGWSWGSWWRWTSQRPTAARPTRGRCTTPAATRSGPTRTSAPSAPSAPCSPHVRECRLCPQRAWLPC